jgi:branched-subunit amino acid transport protein AzlD
MTHIPDEAPGETLAAVRSAHEAAGAKIRLLLWGGLLLPAGVLEARSPVVVSEDPFTAITLFRGLFPGACLLVALLVLRRSPLLWRWPSGRERLLLAYLGLVWLSAAWSLAPLLTLLKAAHLTVAYALLVLLARCWTSRAQALRDITWVVHAVSLAAAAGALLMPDTAFRAGRLVGVFPALESVVLGMIAAVAVVTCLSHGPWERVPAGVRVALSTVATAVLLLTRTRTALVLVVLAGLLLLCLQHRARIAAAAAGSLALVLSAAALTPAGQAAWRTFLRDTEASDLLSFSGRFPLWSDALQVAADRPLVGFGYFAGHRFGLYAEFYALRYGNAPYIDGTWAETLLDLGLIGIAVLGSFVIGCCIHIWRTRNPGSAPSALHLTLLGMLVIYSVQDFTVQQVGYPMAVMAGLLLARVSDPTGSRRRTGVAGGSEIPR